jgi:hypothetical protein
MKFVWGLVKILAEALLLGLLANYLYFAFWRDSAAASGWALGMLLIAVIMCSLGYIGIWRMQRQTQKTPLDEYIEDVHKQEELIQQAAVSAVPEKPDTVTPVLEKLVASSAKNTTTLNLAMENLNSRLDELEEKFIRSQTGREVTEPIYVHEPQAVDLNTPNDAAPSGNYDEEFADIDKLEIMQEPDEKTEYTDIDVDTFLQNADNK